MPTNRTGLVSYSYLGTWETWRRSTDLPGLAATVPHHLGVDGARYAVVLLDVQLGQLVHCKESRICSYSLGYGREKVLMVVQVVGEVLIVKQCVDGNKDCTVYN